MKTPHGLKLSRKGIEDALESDPFRWTFGSQEIVRLVVEGGAIRTRGNAAAHRASPEEIMEAIELMPSGRDQTMLTDLHSYLYPAAPAPVDSRGDGL